MLTFHFVAGATLVARALSCLINENARIPTYVRTHHFSDAPVQREHAVRRIREGRRACKGTRVK